jgi:hypothetical protein
MEIALFWRHPYGAVEPDGLAVQHFVFKDVAHERGVLIWFPEP